MSGVAYRDEDVGLDEKRAAALAGRRAHERKLAAVKRVWANRVARSSAGATATAAALVLGAIDVAAPALATTPEGNTVLGHVLLLVPLVSIVVALYAARRAARVRPFVETGDVRADLERLRGDGGVAETAVRAERLERASLVAPLLGLASWAELGVLHAFVELGGARAIHTYEMLPGGALRAMPPVEALENMARGVGLCALLGTAGFAFALLRGAGRDAPGGAATGAAMLGILMFASTSSQLVSTRFGESAGGVIAGYAAIGLSIGLGVGAVKAIMASTRRLAEREHRALAR